MGDRRRTLALLGVLAVAATVIHAQASEDARRRTRHRTEPAAIGTTRFVIAGAGDSACQHAPYGSAAGPAAHIPCKSAPQGAGAPASCQSDDPAPLFGGASLARVLLLGDNQY